MGVLGWKESVVPQAQQIHSISFTRAIDPVPSIAENFLMKKATRNRLLCRDGKQSPQDHQSGAWFIWGWYVGIRQGFFLFGGREIEIDMAAGDCWAGLGAGILMGAGGQNYPFPVNFAV